MQKLNGNMTNLQITAAMNTTPKKFRIWDRLHRRWFHGATDERSLSFHTDAIDLFGETILLDGLLHDQNEDGAWKDDPNIKASLDVIDYLVVLQNTGVADKTGRYVYEGDIVEFSKIRGVVIYNPADAAYEMWTGDKWVLCALRDSKIIGNVFENPELMSEEYGTD